MIFYQYIYTKNGEPINNFYKEQNKEKIFSRTLEKEAIVCKNFCLDLEDIAFYITSKSEGYLTFICLYKGGLSDLHKLDTYADNLILELSLDLVLYKRQELTLFGLYNELDVAQENNYINNAREIKEIHNLLTSGSWFRERKFSNVQDSKQEMLKKAQNLIVENSLAEEIERIYTPKTDNSFGVPVHYLVNISNDKECESVVEILVNSLKNNNRIIRNIYSTIDLTNKEKFSRLGPNEFGKFYDMNLGGAVVITANFKFIEDDIFTEEQLITELIAEKIKSFSSEVTTILCCKNQSQLNTFKAGLTDLLLIEINDTTISKEYAKNFLLKHAKSLGIVQTLGLTEMIDNDVLYKPNDLINLFNKWYKNYVKTIQYPQYSCFVGQEVKIKETENTHAYKDLTSLIGLNGIKQLISDYINYSKLQKISMLEGKIAKNTCRHMCFVGNPGTAKTTVARYVAQVMKEQGLISKGHIIEAGRGDIVSRYVGGTAPNVQNLFKKAAGGILFIDEAYSLCDGREGMYGDEAINTIVQEMENKRDDIIVIFAGYKKEMESFLQKNSGLRSRIASIIEFPDYTEEELLQIAHYQAEKMGVNISKCETKLKEIIRMGKIGEKNFGNGRFIRNVLEKARIKQASRLVSEDKLFGENLKIIKPEDLEMPKLESKFQMGFC